MALSSRSVSWRPAHGADGPPTGSSWPVAVSAPPGSYSGHSGTSTVRSGWSSRCSSSCPPCRSDPRRIRGPSGTSRSTSSTWSSMPGAAATTSARSTSTPTTRSSGTPSPGSSASVPALRSLTGLLRRLSIGLGYLPSWASPPIEVVARRPPAAGLPDLDVHGRSHDGWPRMLRTVARALRATRPDTGSVAGPGGGDVLTGGQELPLRGELPVRHHPVPVGDRPPGPTPAVAEHPPGRRVGVPDGARHDVHPHDHGQRPPDRHGVDATSGADH